MEQYPIKKYSELDLTNDFVFSKVMMDPELCKELLERILGISILRIEYPEGQKSLAFLPDSRSVRLDVYVKDNANSLYDIEMQVGKTGHLPKRSRYYHSMMDLDALEKGHLYSELGKSFVIFICMFDPFGIGKTVYTFRSCCAEDKGIELGEDRTTVFVNAYGKSKSSSKLAEVLRYLCSRDASGDYSKALDNAIETVLGNRKYEVEYMTLEMKIQEHKEEWLAEGNKEGINEGITMAICAALKKGKTPGEVAELFDIPVEKVLEMAKTADNERDIRSLLCK